MPTIYLVAVLASLCLSSLSLGLALGSYIRTNRPFRQARNQQQARQAMQLNEKERQMAEKARQFNQEEREDRGGEPQEQTDNSFPWDEAFGGKFKDVEPDREFG